MTIGRQSSRGLVVAPQQLAADAGAQALTAGGSAVDAAVAAAFALCVVDPANCGVGGYGGFLVYAPAAGPPAAVEFDTWVPRHFDSAGLRIPGHTDPQGMLRGGRAVAPPAVVPGLVTAHSRFGRRPLSELIAPAVHLARDGFPVDPYLAWTLSNHWQRTGGAVGDGELRAIFYPEGRPPELGTPLVQADLAATLETTSRHGADAFRSGEIVAAICDRVNADGGRLDAADLEHDGVVVGEPQSVQFASATVYGPSRETSGSGVVFSALGSLDCGRLGPNRGEAYVRELAQALAGAWSERVAAARSAQASPHTTHLCAAGADGDLVSLTFTHGPWFGSGIVPPGTGIVLNGGANLFAPSASGPVAVTNMAPLVVDDTLRDIRHAVGGTGGPRIPGMLLSAVVDVVHYGTTLSEAIAAPHVSVRASDGRPEVERGLLELFAPDEEVVTIQPGDFGPGFGITHGPGGYVGAVDDRFESGLARA